jgi:hypothetical protein
MTTFDINLLGKRYPELDPLSNFQDGDIIALYRTGQPELNRINWLQIKNSIDLIKTGDFIGVTPTNGLFPRWSSTANKFVLGSVGLNDIPNLDASKITTGTFNDARIPFLPISRITGLQTSLDNKEPVFNKGSVVSSTLVLTGNTNRLYGSGNLGIEIDTNAFSNLFIPANRTITFVSDDNSIFINGLHIYTKNLNNPLENINLEANITPYVHPTGFTSQPVTTPLSGANVISRIIVTDEGHVEEITTRAMTKADIGLSNVDNTSDLDKPISTATQTAINNLDSRFLRKDANDNNSTFTLTLGNLTVSTAVLFTGLSSEMSPDYALALMNDGTVRKTTIVTPSEISDLQDQIDGLQLQINAIVEDKNFVHLQTTDSATWTVNHNLGKDCAINVYDSAGNSVRFAINQALSNLNTTVIVLLSAIQGKATFN